MTTLADMLNAERTIVIAGHTIVYRQLTIAQIFNSVIKGLCDQAKASGSAMPKGQEMQKQAQKCVEGESFPVAALAPMIWAATKDLNPELIQKLADAEALTVTDHIGDAMKLVVAICGGDVELLKTTKVPKKGKNGRAEGKAVAAAASS